MSRQRDVQLGQFVAGEVPAPLVYMFLDSDGDPIDLTGYSAIFVFRIGSGDPIERAAAPAPGAGVGAVEYVWQADDLDSAGLLRAEFTATNGTNTFTSARLLAWVRAALAGDA